MSGRSILVTGATGSFGSAFVRHLCTTTTSGTWRRIIVFSRDELKQSEMQQRLTDDRLRWFVGDVRDSERLALAFRDVQVVVHAAALKRVETMEQNPMEAVRTNIGGSMHVVQTAITHGVEAALLLSTDKAVQPINLYGMTKGCAERLFLNANTYASTKFSVVRYGNVAGSRGSVILRFRECRTLGLPLPVTHPAMTRFWITIPQAVQFVTQSLATMRGGDVFVPRMPSVRIQELADLMADGVGIRVMGIRPGEKLHEVCIGAHEDIEGLPSPYSSDANTEWLEGARLREAIACV